MIERSKRLAAESGWYGDDSTIEPREGGQVRLMGGHILGVVTQWIPEAWSEVAQSQPETLGHESGIGLDWYAVDPNLRFLLDRHLPDPDDRAFAEEHVGRFGTLVGGDVARRAEITDKHGPELRRYNRWGYEVDEVVHHPAWTAAE